MAQTSLANESGSEAKRDPWTVFTRSESRSKKSIPIWPLACGADNNIADAAKSLPDGALQRWLEATGFKNKAGRHAIVPNDNGEIAGVAFALGGPDTGRPCGPGELLTGALARNLPAGDYHIEGELNDPELAAVAWGLGAYKFDRYKKNKSTGSAKLEIPKGADPETVATLVEASWLGRDLINTPASDLGPAELEVAANELAKRYGAEVSVVTGDALLSKNFPLIHAVGRASPREPRLIDIRWTPPHNALKDPINVTLVGKGICFDTGGLDLKPSANMILMKKDMGGAASALALGQMIMGCGTNIKLRILIAAAENSVSGNAFRPSDVLTSRAGLTVEIGNTDAEGRLVLADALAYADEEKPDHLISLATLTGSARVALGPDLPAFFSTSDAFSQAVHEVGQRIGDPIWPMPFWADYDRKLKSPVADICNITNDPFAGAITAALFLKRFVKNVQTYAHVDMYGWRPSNDPLGIKGGEAHAARSLFAALRKESEL